MITRVKWKEDKYEMQKKMKEISYTRQVLRNEKHENKRKKSIHNTMKTRSHTKARAHTFHLYAHTRLRTKKNRTKNIYCSLMKCVSHLQQPFWQQLFLQMCALFFLSLNRSTTTTFTFPAKVRIKQKNAECFTASYE